MRAWHNTCYVISIVCNLTYHRNEPNQYAEFHTVIVKFPMELFTMLYKVILTFESVTRQGGSSVESCYIFNV